LEPLRAKIVEDSTAANGGNATRAAYGRVHAAYGRVHNAEAVSTLRSSNASRMSATLADDAEH
jgi:hypothetical protein